MQEMTFWNELWDTLKRIVLKVVGMLQSRKFLAAMGATLVILTNEGVTEASLNKIAAIWIAFILGTALEDGLSRR